MALAPMYFWTFANILNSIRTTTPYHSLSWDKEGGKSRPASERSGALAVEQYFKKKMMANIEHNR